MVIRNIVRQLETPDRLRGRMIGVNMVFFMGGPQLGELEAGAVANWLGAPFSVDQRRHRLPDRDRLGGGDDAGVAALRPSSGSGEHGGNGFTRRNEVTKTNREDCQAADVTQRITRCDRPAKRPQLNSVETQT